MTDQLKKSEANTRSPLEEGPVRWFHPESSVASCFTLASQVRFGLCPCPPNPPTIDPRLISLHPLDTDLLEPLLADSPPPFLDAAADESGGPSPHAASSASCDDTQSQGHAMSPGHRSSAPVSFRPSSSEESYEDSERPSKAARQSPPAHRSGAAIGIKHDLGAVLVPEAVSDGSIYSVRSSPSGPLEAPRSAGRPHSSSPEIGPAASQGSPPEPAVPALPYHTASFPPGRAQPGFVPLGHKGTASAAQGNHWPIELQLRGDIVHAELDNYKRRPEEQRLSYREILEKYDQWNVDDSRDGRQKGVVASSLRGYNRRYNVPDRSHLERIPTWTQQHLDALRRAVPQARRHKGMISWTTVRGLVRKDTGRAFGPATLSAKWKEIRKRRSRGEVGMKSSDGDSSEGEEESASEASDDENSMEGSSPGRRKGEDEDEDNSMGEGPSRLPAGPTRA
ncbi:unnamed protein product [Discula destructiva]